MGADDVVANGWAIEKSLLTVKGIALALDKLRKADQADENIIQAMDILSTRIHDAVKILAYFCNVEFLPDDAFAVRDYGIRGYEAVAVRYGRLAETKEQLYLKDIEVLLGEINHALEIGRGEGRQLIYELLFTASQNENSNVHRAKFEKLRLLSEDLVEGKITWDVYCGFIRAELVDLRDWLESAKSRVLVL